MKQRPLLSLVMFLSLMFMLPMLAQATCQETIIPSGSPFIPDTIILNCDPSLQNFELQRAIILGNPPKRQMLYIQPGRPDWVTRPAEIPSGYPGRLSDGIVFE